MKIKILKDHVSGLKAGEIKSPTDAIAKKLIANGLAEEVKTRKPKEKK
jgi:hypothetical protein